MNNRNPYILPVSILALSIIFSSTVIVLTWKSNYKSNQTINVTGSAKKEIISDLGVLKGNISVQSSTQSEAYKELNSQMQILLSYLESNGFTKDKVDLSTMNSYPIYEIGANGYQTNVIRAYSYTQRIEVQSTDVNKIKNMSLEISSLVERGVNFNVEMPEYHYTKLAELKIDVQAAAAKDAMVRAEKIAEATGRNIGTMRDARMGVLQITPKLSNQISDYGINDLSSIEKEITAVVNASFEIE